MMFFEKYLLNKELELRPKSSIRMLLSLYTQKLNLKILEHKNFTGDNNFLGLPFVMDLTKCKLS